MDHVTLWVRSSLGRPSRDYAKEEPLIKQQQSAGNPQIAGYRTKRWSFMHTICITTGIISALTIYTWFAVSVALHFLYFDDTCRNGSQLVPNYAEDGLQYLPKLIESYDYPDNPLFGKPSKELDQNWDEFTRYNEVGIPASEIRRLGRESNSVRLPDGKYFAMPTVYHHLHCLQRLHWSVHEDYYFPNITARERALLDEHTIHCFDLLKEAVMCQGDMTLLTMYWQKSVVMPAANWSTPHVCADWSKIEDWSKEHAFDSAAPGMLVHPELGPVFVDGESQGSRTGVDK